MEPKDIALRVKLIDLLHKHGTGETDEHDGETIDQLVERLVFKPDHRKEDSGRHKADGSCANEPAYGIRFIRPASGSSSRVFQTDNGSEKPADHDPFRS